MADNFSCQNRLGKLLIGHDGEISQPKYLSAVGWPLIKIRDFEIFNPTIDQDWPTTENFGCSESNLKALKSCLTKELTLIKGSVDQDFDVELIEIFLNNWRLWKKNIISLGSELNQDTGPILYITKSSKVLDQFLEALSNKFDLNEKSVKLSRIGQQHVSNGFKLEEIMVQNQVKSMKFNSPVIAKILQDLMAQRKEFMTIYEVLNSIGQLVNFSSLRGISEEITTEFPLGLRTLVNNTKWLGLHDDIFKSQHFSEEFLIRKGFGLESKPTPQNPQITNSIDNLHLVQEVQSLFVVMGISPSTIADISKTTNLKENYYLKGYFPTESQGFENSVIFLKKLQEYYGQGRLCLMNDVECVGFLRKYKNGEISMKELSQKDKFSMYFYMARRSWKCIVEKIKEIDEKIARFVKNVKSQITMGVLKDVSLVGIESSELANYCDTLRNLKSRIVIFQEANAFSVSDIVSVLSENCQNLILIADIAAKSHQDFERIIEKNVVSFPLDKIQSRDRDMQETNNNNLEEKEILPVIQNPSKDCGHEKGSRSNECQTLVSKTLNCGHQAKVKCHEKICNIMCQEIVERVLKCGHTIEAPCSQDLEHFICEKIVQKPLICGNHWIDLPCTVNPDPNTLECQVKVKTQFPCGHSIELDCGSKLKFCDVQIKKKFPDCEHQIAVKCHEKEMKFDCYETCGIRLDCGHKCDLLCHKKFDAQHSNYQCNKKCARKCLKGHQCSSGHFCSSPCPPCQYPCSKILNTCCHMCQETCSKEPCGPCQMETLKESRCGHFQEILCSETASEEICQVLVSANCSSFCGHAVQVECRRAEMISPEECLGLCSSPCGHLFENCTHYCVGSCQECQGGRFHLKCQANCDRRLICGHLCSYPCSSSCPPCTQFCNFKCEHSSCGKVCGEPCNPCIEQCTWICEHKKCSKLCSEFCDREPCDEPCKKKIACGHDCIGLCGDLCPTKCRICDLDELKDVFLINEYEEDSRFVMLEDCSHCFEVSELDQFMSTSENGEIMAKLCPTCRVLIKNSKRYGNYIKQTEQDIHRIKEMVYGKISENTTEQNELIRKLENDQDFAQVLPHLSQFLLNILTKDQEKGKKVLNKIDKMFLRSLTILYNHGQETIKTLKKFKTEITNAEYIEILSNNYLRKFELILDRKIPYSTTELQDLDLEFDRVFDLGQAYVRRCLPNYGSNDQNKVLFGQLLETINQPKRYDQAFKLQVQDLFKQYDISIRNSKGLSSRERAQILEAINLRQGHWYKCPNGHIYVIADCGRAMQVSRCNECGAAIGGQSHNLLPNNTATQF